MLFALNRFNKIVVCYKLFVEDKCKLKVAKGKHFFESTSKGQ